MSAFRDYLQHQMDVQNATAAQHYNGQLAQFRTNAMRRQDLGLAPEPFPYPVYKRVVIQTGEGEYDYQDVTADGIAAPAELVAQPQIVWDGNSMVFNPPLPKRAPNTGFRAG